jgi:hypothetical protein
VIAQRAGQGGSEALLFYIDVGRDGRGPGALISAAGAEEKANVLNRLCLQPRDWKPDETLDHVFSWVNSCVRVHLKKPSIAIPGWPRSGRKT